MSELAEKSKDFLQRKAIHTEWQSDYLNPDMDAFYDLAFTDILRRIKASPDSTILDAGCGYCYHTLRLARSGAQITAVDFSEAALETAQQTIDQVGISHQVSLKRADLTSLPFADASFDFVVSWGVLMHIPEMEMALSQMSRVLKPGGILVLNENNMHSFDVAIRERLVRAVKRLIGRGDERITKTERGLEVWKRSGDDGGLMVRKTDMKFLSMAMARLGLQEIARTPSQLSEAYTNLPSRFLKRAIYALNSFYFKRSMPAALSLGNIVYFLKN